MLTLARSLLRDRDESDDVVEDALIRIHDAAPRFRGERGLKTWVLRIVANRCRDLLRRRKFSAGPPEDLDPLSASGLSHDPSVEWEEGIDRERLLAALERAIDSLPPDQREAVVMRDRLGLPYEEAAEALGVSLPALKSRLFRARATLARKLAELEGA